MITDEVSNLSLETTRENRTICTKWNLGSCSDENIIAVYLLLHRNGNDQHIFDALDKLQYILCWKVNAKIPLSEASLYYGRQECCCKEKLFNMFCPILCEVQMEVPDLWMENAHNCF